MESIILYALFDPIEKYINIRVIKKIIKDIHAVDKLYLLQALYIIQKNNLDNIIVKIIYLHPEYALSFAYKQKFAIIAIININNGK